MHAFDWSLPVSKRLSESTRVGVEASEFRSTKPSKAAGRVAVAPVASRRFRRRDAPVMHGARRPDIGTLPKNRKTLQIAGFSVSRASKPDSSPQESSGRRIWLDRAVSGQSAIPRRTAEGRARDAPVMHGCCCRCQQRQRGLRGRRMTPGGRCLTGVRDEAARRARASPGRARGRVRHYASNSCYLELTSGRTRYAEFERSRAEGDSQQRPTKCRRSSVVAVLRRRQRGKCINLV
jgi:hypothetical protein